MANVTYPVASTTAQLVVSVGANYQEQAWEKGVVIGAAARHPLSALKQGSNNLNKRIPNSAIVTTTTLNNGIYGQVANFQVRAPLGGFGTQGAGGYRSGKGEEAKDKMYTLTTGVHHHSRQRNNVSAAQCRIGVGSFDVETQAQLKEWYGWATGNLLEAEIIRATTTDSTVTNRTVFYANQRSSLDELTSADVLTLEDITRLENALNENMAQPFSLTTDGVSDISEYLIMAPHYGWDALRATDEWKNLLKLAGERGSKNQLFGGGMPKWGGSKLFDWRIQVPDSYGPAGCFAAPFAFLGEAIAAGSTAFTIKGGGSAAAAALTDRAYFIHFPNSQFKMFEQEKIARDTSTTRYVIAKHATQKKWAFASYKVTAAGDLDDATGTIAPANTLTIFKMLSATNAGDALNTLGDITWGAGVFNGLQCEWSDLPVGSKLYPCNSKGQPYVQVYGLGQHAMIDGHGRVTDDGSVGMGQRTENLVTDMGRLKQIGMVMSYGANAVIDTNGIPRGMVRMYAAYNPPGLPEIQ